MNVANPRQPDNPTGDVAPTPPRIAVLRTLAGLTDWATLEEIATLTNLSRQTVYAQIAALAAMGLVRRDTKRRPVCNPSGSTTWREVYVWTATKTGREVVTGW